MSLQYYGGFQRNPHLPYHARCLEQYLSSSSWDRIFGRNLDISLKSFSSLLFSVTSTLYSSDLRFLFIQITQPLTVSRAQLLYIHCKRERRKNWYKTSSPSLWYKKSIQKPQAWELWRLCPETSTKLHVHEFCFSTPIPVSAAHPLARNIRRCLFNLLYITIFN